MCKYKNNSYSLKKYIFSKYIFTRIYIKKVCENMINMLSYTIDNVHKILTHLYRLLV